MGEVRERDGIVHGRGEGENDIEGTRERETEGGFGEIETDRERGRMN